VTLGMDCARADSCIYELAPPEPPYEVLGTRVVPQSNILGIAECGKTIDDVRAEIAREAERRAQAVTVTPPAQPAPVPPGLAGRPAPSFKTCAAARAAGYHNIRKGTPGYAPYLDWDNDGIACEW
jgi:hypothetical protein